MQTKEDLKKIAIDLADGKIFSDRHLGKSASYLLGQVFMPIIFGGLTEEFKEG